MFSLGMVWIACTYPNNTKHCTVQPDPRTNAPACRRVLDVCKSKRKSIVLARLERPPIQLSICWQVSVGDAYGAVCKWAYFFPLFLSVSWFFLFIDASGTIQWKRWIFPRHWNIFFSSFLFFFILRESERKNETDREMKRNRSRSLGPLSFRNRTVSIQPWWWKKKRGNQYKHIEVLGRKECEWQRKKEIEGIRERERERKKERKRERARKNVLMFNWTKSDAIPDVFPAFLLHITSVRTWLNAAAVFVFVR